MPYFTSYSIRSPTPNGTGAIGCSIHRTGGGPVCAALTGAAASRRAIASLAVRFIAVPQDRSLRHCVRRSLRPAGRFLGRRRRPAPATPVAAPAAPRATPSLLRCTACLTTAAGLTFYYERSFRTVHDGFRSSFLSAERSTLCSRL